MTRINEFDQPIGPDLGTWTTPAFPSRNPMTGLVVELVALDPAAHAAALFEAFRDAPDSLWTYMSFGPFASVTQLESTLESIVDLDDWQAFTIVANGRISGFLSYLRIDPPAGTIEIGSIVFAPSLQRTRAATEALYLTIKRCFDLGYRRCEWKCDALNAPSRRAAERLGFVYEGTFRKATHYKGRNRDTAWFAIVDDDWPAFDQRFRRWLAPENFIDGIQRRSL